MENLLKDRKEHGFEEYTENLVQDKKSPCSKKDGNSVCYSKENTGILIQKNN